MQHQIASLAKRLSEARGVVVLTGAGVSAESGIRTFRDSMEALWKEFDPAKLATPEAFDADPAMVTRWYDWRRVGCLAAEPNPGHLALAEIERRTQQPRRFTLLTQNVDRLHQKAGSQRVVELHGSIIEWRCTHTGTKTLLPPEAHNDFPLPSPFAPGALLRPDVVWFGEALPEVAVQAADEAMAECDVFLSIGTSSQVYPAAGYVRHASVNGAFTAEINKEPTPISNWVDLALHGTSGVILPKIVEQMR